MKRIERPEPLHLVGQTLFCIGAIGFVIVVDFCTHGWLEIRYANLLFACAVIFCISVIVVPIHQKLDWLIDKQESRSKVGTDL